MAKALDKDIYFYESFNHSYGIELPNDAKSFDGLNKGNLELTVPKQSLSLYRAAPVGANLEELRNILISCAVLPT